MIKPIKKTSENTRRSYDETFKRETISHWLASGKSAQVIADEFGIRSELLYAWRKIYAPVDAGGKAAPGAKPGSASDLQAQLAAAMDEIRHLKEQRDILKKTLGILSEPPRNGSKGSTR